MMGTLIAVLGLIFGGFCIGVLTMVWFLNNMRFYR